jgi:hypothetical protein
MVTATKLLASARPHRTATTADIGNVTGEVEAVVDVTAALDRYLTDFVVPVEESDRRLCVGCGRWLDDTFRWLITRGEGECGACRWPLRAFHRVTWADAELSFTALIQYRLD